MTDTTITIYGENRTVEANRHLGSWPDINLGETATFRFEVPKSELTKLFDYQRYAGGFTTYQEENTDYFYLEHLPDTATVESLVVGIEPSTDLEDITGVWGLVTSVNDVRNSPLNTNQVEIELYVFAQFATFDTILEARANRDVSILTLLLATGASEVSVSPGDAFVEFIERIEKTTEAPSVSLSAGDSTLTLIQPVGLTVDAPSVSVSAGGQTLNLTAEPAFFDVTIQNTAFTQVPITESIESDDVTVSGGDQSLNIASAAFFDVTIQNTTFVNQ